MRVTGFGGVQRFGGTNMGSGMKSITKFASAGIIAAALATPAAAQDMMSGGYEGPYMFGAIGGHWSHDMELDGGGVDTDLGNDIGPGGLAGFGYDFNDFRAELELGYRENDFEGSGDTQTKSLMANMFYDFGDQGGWEPYVGVGAGLGRVTLDGVNVTGGGTFNDDDTGPAFQAAAGAAFPIGERVKLTVDYRFLTVQSLDFTSSTGANPESEVYDHGIFVGLRWQLSAPPKPVPAAQPAPPAQPQTYSPPPAPAPVREFLVFFDWDQADLTPEAREILQAAAAEARRVGAVRIVATGHADRSGPNAYNERLSQRRADNVRNALMSLGIQGGEIATFAKGESDPLVATADGVREPRNRRVQIVLE